MAEDKKKRTDAEAEAENTAGDSAEKTARNEEHEETSEAAEQSAGRTEDERKKPKGRGKTEKKTGPSGSRDGEKSGEAEEHGKPADEAEKPADEAEEPEDESAKLREKVEHLTDQLQRQMAEFDNFRKRTEKEKSTMFDMGARSVIEKILPVVDNFERGLATVPEEEKDDAFVSGMDKVYRQLQTELDALGVKPIEAVGQKFDPDRHNAVMHVDDEKAGENEVVEEFLKGYTYKDTVVRYSMVKVAN